MTALDEAALEKAYTAYDLCPSLEAAIRAYIEALPPAQKRWVKKSKTGKLSVMTKMHGPWSSRDEWRVPVEVREIREPADTPLQSKGAE